MSEERSASAAVRCCLHCGRWGSRGYRPADDAADGWICANDRACQRRLPALVGGPRVTVRVAADRGALTGYWRESEAGALDRYLAERANDPNDDARYETRLFPPGSSES